MIQFAPGPSELYMTVQDHARRAFRDGIPSLSHRSKTFESIYQSCDEGLRALLGIPAEYKIFFAASATEIWERSVQNLTSTRSHHVVAGAFGKKYYETALYLGRHATIREVREGSSPAEAESSDAELLALTLNETSTGTQLTPELIRDFRTHNPQSLIIIDAVSALPHLSPDYNLVDSVFFSVQKGFGLPAGLGVWMVNDRCIEKASQLTRDGKGAQGYHSLQSYAQHYKKFQTPETPNVLGIYLLSKVVADFNSRGIKSIRSETTYKASILYNALDQHPHVSSFVSHPSDRSQTVIVANCGEHTTALAKHLESHGMQAGDGYGVAKKTQLRFANFPAHSKEWYERLVDQIEAYKG